MGEADRRIELDTVTRIAALTLNIEAIAAAVGRWAEEHGDFRLRRRGIHGRPAGRAEIEPVVKTLLLEKWKEQGSPSEAAGPIAIFIAKADAESRAVGGRVSGEVGGREDLVGRFVVEQGQPDLLE